MVTDCRRVCKVYYAFRPELVRGVSGEMIDWIIFLKDDLKIMSRVSRWFRYWLENFKTAKDKYDLIALGLSILFFVAGLFLRTTNPQTQLTSFVSDEVLGRICILVGVILFFWCLMWFPVCRHEAEASKHDQHRRTLETEISVLKNCQDRRALLKKIIEAIKKGRESLIVGIPGRSGPTCITGPIDSIGGLIAFAEDIKNEDEVEWLCQELVKHGFDHPFTYTDLYCNDFMLGHRLPVLREAGLNEQRPLYGELFVRFLKERWSEKEKWLEIERKYNETMALPARQPR
jgi:hypothetical protein